jgi:hypothetical protein
MTKHVLLSLLFVSIVCGKCHGFFVVTLFKGTLGSISEGDNQEILLQRMELSACLHLEIFLVEEGQCVVQWIRKGYFGCLEVLVEVEQVVNAVSLFVCLLMELPRLFERFMAV